MKLNLSRRNFVRSTAMLATAATLPIAKDAFGQLTEASGKPSPIKLGIASYTFRNFPRAQMITWLKQLNITSINPKDAKDHLPMDPTAEAQALADYQANGIQLHAAGAIYFQKDDDDDIRAKFEYC